MSEGADVFEDQEPDEIAGAIDQLGAAGAGGKVRILRYERHGTRETWARCSVVPASDFVADDVGVVYGPGRYRFQVVNDRGRIVKHAELTFAAPADHSVSAPAPPGGGASSAPSVDAGAASGSFLERMCLILLQGIVAKPADTVKASDILTAVKTGVEMGRGSGGMGEAMDAIRAGIDLNRAAADDREPRRAGGFFESFGDRALGLVETILSRAPVASAPAANPGGDDAGVQGAPSLSTAAPSPARRGGLAAAVGDPLIFMAKQYAPVLLREAEKDRDPLLWGQFVAERVPDSFVPALLVLCQAEPEQRIAALAQIEPRLSQYRAWIDEAAGAIVGELLNVDDEGNDHADPIGGGGDLPLAGGDASNDNRGGATPGDPQAGGDSLARDRAR
jgi:hypothetical protein